ncbi:MAG: Ig-like domain-containing protein [Microgenomates group bacterium]|nr:Ig-like domain-containing protein [Microgenomates group bacterium]
MDKKFVALMVLFFLSVTVFTSIVVFNRPLTQLTKATEELQPSASNSHIFAWPLTVKADGQDKSTLTVFGANYKNNPISLINKQVTLSTTLGQISEEPISEEKRKQGEAVFVIKSTQPGIAEIKATIDNVQLNQSVTIKFE